MNRNRRVVVLPGMGQSVFHYVCYFLVFASGEKSTTQHIVAAIDIGISAYRHLYLIDALVVTAARKAHPRFGTQNLRFFVSAYACFLRRCNGPIDPFLLPFKVVVVLSTNIR